MGATNIKKGNLWPLILLVFFTFLVSVVITNLTPVRQLQHKVTDQLFSIRGPITPADSTIVLVSISQQANEAIPHKYPWPTRYYAKLIENLNKAGARAIGLDVVFDKADSNPADDSLFAAALKKYGNVVLAGNVHIDRQARGHGSESVATSLVKPNPILSDANPNPLGLVKVIKDNDDEVRRQLMQLNFRHQTYYPLTLELLRIYNGWKQLNLQAEEAQFNIGRYHIPRYNKQTMAINYAGPATTFPQYSFDNVIDDSTILLENEDPQFQTNAFSDPNFGLLKGKVFKDKIVIVGATMAELHDFHATPFAPNGAMPGYEIQANALQTMLSGRYIYYMPNSYLLGLLLGLSFIIVWVTRKGHALWGLLFYVGLSIMLIFVTVYVFLGYRYVMNLTGPLITLTMGYLATNSYEYFTEQREKKRIRGMFSSYVSPDLVEKMITSGQEPQLGGDEQFLTAFFSDIASFSSFSEKLTAQELVTLINEYLSALTDILVEGGGTLDKYIGDAIVAIFGAPVPQQNHAYKACITAQKMQNTLGRLRAKWKEEKNKWPPIVQHMRTRIGINTGTMVTGNMGSQQRFNYTMMGDNVNLAARCESGAKKYGVFTMVTRSTREQAEKVGKECVFRYLDRIVVKGRTEPVEIYEIMGFRHELGEEDFRCRELFEQGIKHYKNKQWDAAITCFEQSKGLEKHQPGGASPVIKTNPSLVYLKRCNQMKAQPPGPDWDGIWIMQTK